MRDIEEHIRRAMEEGKFDNLPGQGKPLHLDDNPLADPEWRVAHHMLKSNGFTLPWIEARKEIEAELEAARAALRRARDWEQAARGKKKPEAGVKAQWQQAVAAFQKQIEAINKKILTYNLQAPSPGFQILALKAEREVERILNGES